MFLLPVWIAWDCDNWNLYSGKRQGMVVKILFVRRRNNGKVIPEPGKLQNSESPNPGMFVFLLNTSRMTFKFVSKTRPSKTTHLAFQFIVDETKK